MTHRSSPAEEIQAAIDKLTALKAESTPGPWSRSDELWDGSGRWEILGPDGHLVSSDGDGIGSFDKRDDPDLIVTLHRTIDAQLAILRAALNHSQHPSHIFRGPGADLVRAINGGA